MSRFPRNIVAPAPRLPFQPAVQVRSQIQGTPLVSNDLALLNQGLTALGQASEALSAHQRQKKAEERARRAEGRAERREDRAVAGGIAAQLRRDAAAKRREENAEEQETRRLAAEAKAAAKKALADEREEVRIDTAAGSLAASGDLLTILQRLGEGEVPSDGDLAGIQEELLTGGKTPFIDPDQSEAYKNAYRRAVNPAIREKLISRRNAARDFADRDTIDVLAGGMHDVDKVDDAKAQIDRAMGSMLGKEMTKHQVSVLFSKQLARFAVSGVLEGDDLERAYKRLDVAEEIGGPAVLDFIAGQRARLDKKRGAFDDDLQKEYAEETARLINNIADNPATLVKSIRKWGNDKGRPEGEIRTYTAQGRAAYNGYIADQKERRIDEARNTLLTSSWLDTATNSIALNPNVTLKNFFMPSTEVNGTEVWPWPGSESEARKAGQKAIYANFLRRMKPEPGDERGWLKRNGFPGADELANEDLPEAIARTAWEAQRGFLLSADMPIDEPLSGAMKALGRMLKTRGGKAQDYESQKFKVAKNDSVTIVGPEMTTVDMVRKARELQQSSLLGLYMPDTDERDLVTTVIRLAQNPHHTIASALEALTNRDPNQLAVSVEEIIRDIRSNDDLTDDIVDMLKSRFKIDPEIDPRSYELFVNILAGDIAIGGGRPADALGRVADSLEGSVATVNGHFVYIGGDEHALNSANLTAFVKAAGAHYLRDNEWAKEKNIKAGDISLTRLGDAGEYVLTAPGIMLDMLNAHRFSAGDIKIILQALNDEDVAQGKETARQHALDFNKRAELSNSRDQFIFLPGPHGMIVGRVKAKKIKLKKVPEPTTFEATIKTRIGPDALDLVRFIEDMPAMRAASAQEQQDRVEARRKLLPGQRGTMGFEGAVKQLSNLFSSE